MTENRTAAMDHDCMDYRERVNREGDDVLVEVCSRCGRLRHETDGVRPMAWFVDPRNPTGHRYAYSPPGNDPDKPTIWRHP